MKKIFVLLAFPVFLYSQAIKSYNTNGGTSTSSGSGITQLLGAVTTALGTGPQTATITPTGVAAGSYTCLNGQINLAGQIISASSGSCSGTGGLFINAANPPFNLVCDGSTDNTAGMTTLQAFQQGNPGVMVVFPPGTCLYQGYAWLWGATNVTWVGTGTGTALRNSQTGGFNLLIGGDDFNCSGWTGNVQTPAAYRSFSAGIAAINTVSAKSNTVTVQVPSNIASWLVGDPVLITGFDQQAGGYPPNYRYFDRAKIFAINYSTGVVTLDRSLTNNYNQNWPFFTSTANTYPPSIKNLRSAIACPSGGSLGQMQYFHAINIDFSTLPASQVGSVDAEVFPNDVAYAQFDNCKFGSLGPSQSGIVYINGGSINTSEPDKLADQFIINGTTFYGGQSPSTTHTALVEGTGLNYIELTNSNILGGLIQLSPRRFYSKNSTFHSIGTAGILNTALGGIDWYNPSYIVENPVLYEDGLSQGGIFGGNVYKSIVVSTATSGAFTVSSGDIPLTVGLLGPGSAIRGSNSTNTSAILGTVTDVVQSGSTVQVLGTWGTSITAGQTIYYDPNPINTVLSNPYAADFDINTIGITFNPFGSNVRAIFDIPTTVSDLGTCSFLTSGAGVGGITTKWVKDSLTSSYNGTGGGNFYAQVKCDPTTSQWVGFGSSSSMVYPSAGIPVSTGSAWGSSLTPQGTGTTVPLTTGTTTTNDCAKWDASGNIIDAGSACGSGGSLPTQSVQSYLKSNGTTASWGDIITGPTGALCAGTGCSGGTPGIIDVVTSVVPTNTTAFAPTGQWDFSGTAAGSKVMRELASDPGTCSVGETYLNNSASPYVFKACTSSNTWVAVGGSSGGSSPVLYGPVSQVLTFDFATCPTGTSQTLATFTIPASTLTVGSQARIKWDIQQINTINFQSAFPTINITYGTGGIDIFPNLAGLNSPGNIYRGEGDFTTFTSTSQISNGFSGNATGFAALGNSQMANSTASTSSSIPVSVKMVCGTPTTTMSGQIYVHSSLEVWQ